MINEAVLLESRSLRKGVVARTEVLDRVKTLSLLPDGMHVTTAMVAAYFEVAETVINNLLSRHREELEVNGLRVLRGAELQEFKELTLSSYPESYPQPRSGMAVWPRRAVLNVAMLLRDSEVARQVRTYLLDMEYMARTAPVDNSVHNPADSPASSLDDCIDRRITHILGTAVVPMFNALIETSSEHRRELIDLRQDIQRVERRLCHHHSQLRRLEGPRKDRVLAGVMGAIDAMNGYEFEDHVADLLRRDGCTDVVVRGGHGDRGVDITGRTPDGRPLVVQCKRFAPHSSVTSPDIQKFLGAAKVLHKADVALYVATCPFTRDALNISAEGGITAVHRGLLETWSAGTPLNVLR
ncbi:restriction endonuclease [Streptomyces sp. NPDC002730]|uniref:restriction endonuclease n=1 Tax=Streptomyces sp. NPDC002730 TaxID=3364662 RepID=UPI0036BDF814